jgi:hypothetical protein
MICLVFLLGWHSGGAMTPKPYKFQAFVTISSGQDSDPSHPPPAAAAALPPGQLKRMAVRGEHHQTHGSHFFCALVANSDDNPDWIGDNHAIVTVMLTAEDAADYFCAGDHFALWLGHDIADGIVTRRVFA